MGRASSSKKVQRAARAGGGRRTAKQRSGSWTWGAVMGVVVVLGIGLIVFSRNQRQAAGQGPPPRFGDHWHAAYGFDICGSFLPDLASPNPPLQGIHSHSDGVIHVEPSSTLDTGTGATVGRWVKSQPGLSITAKEIKVDGKTYKNGDKCGTTAALVRASVNGKEFTGDPRDIRPKNGDRVTFAFVAKDATIPEPPNAQAKIAKANAGLTEPGAQQPGTSVPPPSSATLPPTTAPTTGAPPTTAKQ